ncbi:DUF4240 domain-containing protein [Kitasatospora sp. NPDC056731]|uniref:DUF4240 domain-containing protein n=1 Tax=Kitasatospora sp. NPDC056731 TaxID=3155422 RepID=UPI00343004C1
MDLDTFWQIIDDTRTGAADESEHADALTEYLAGLAPDQIADFDRHYAQQKARSCTWLLWGAGYLVNGGCSDDGFDYFRDWLIGAGRTLFEQALADPDSLAELLTPDQEELEAEDLAYAATHAYRQLTGADLPSSDITSVPPTGEPWEDEDLPALLPHLSARFAD